MNLHDLVLVALFVQELVPSDELGEDFHLLHSIVLFALEELGDRLFYYEGDVAFGYEVAVRGAAQ